MAVNRWVWIAAGAGAFLVLLIVALIGFGVYYVGHHVHTGPATLAEAQRQFDEIRSHYAGRPPLVEFTGGAESEPVVHREALTNTEANLQSLDVLVWDNRQGRLVRVSIPFWLVRLSNGRFNVSGARLPSEFDGTHLTPAELERYGPGLLLDFEQPGHGRVLALLR
jgi:hypothetical protein